MTVEGTYKTSGELVLNAEEKKELIIPKAARSSNNEQGVDTVPEGTTTATTNVNNDHVHETPSPVNLSSSFSNINGNQHTQSNMIISGEQIKSNVNLILATCSGTLSHLISNY